MVKTDKQAILAAPLVLEIQLSLLFTCNIIYRPGYSSLKLNNWGKYLLIIKKFLPQLIDN